MNSLFANGMLDLEERFGYLLRDLNDQLPDAEEAARVSKRAASKLSSQEGE